MLPKRTLVAFCPADVRSDKEWKVAHIPGAVHLHLYHDFTEAALANAVGKDEAVVVYGRADLVGHLSTQAAATQDTFFRRPRRRAFHVRSLSGARVACVSRQIAADLEPRCLCVGKDVRFGPHAGIVVQATDRYRHAAFEVLRYDGAAHATECTRESGRRFVPSDRGFACNPVETLAWGIGIGRE